MNITYRFNKFFSEVLAIISIKMICWTETDNMGRWNGIISETIHKDKLPFRSISSRVDVVMPTYFMDNLGQPVKCLIPNGDVILADFILPGC